ncbi:hypothetical protein BTO04_05295 [Polaribacter sp. SA4-10]|uniref:restriction endonuclease subunit S n=1 Tax=Polaribacter sp. SA4-10 TaxID=754397 RepID=UPI000B3C5526|nr:restriction endonuclease subunit S [Polaribacter sp. SA4-10]ARV06151.1 hypothetical protein BTO04_05295 [Polaribacter sp. SA4-10]
MDKQKNKTPLVRFPEFKVGWEHKQLNELLTVSKAKNGDLKYDKEDVLSVSGESGIVNQIEHLGRSYAGVSVHNYGVVELNQIVYTKSPLKANPYGIIKLNKRKAGIVSTLYAVYKVNDKTDGQFIEYYFSLDANLNRYLRPLVKKGAKNDMKISNEYVLNDRIYAPKLEEQKRIAHFFNIVDIKLSQLQEKLNGLEDYKKGMMQQIFKQQLRFKDENAQDFPEWTKLKFPIKIVAGSAYELKNYVKKGVILIQGVNISPNKLKIDTPYFISVNNNKNHIKLTKGDILLGLNRPIVSGKLKVCIYDLKVEGYLYQRAGKLDFNKDKINPVFLYQFLRSNHFLKEVEIELVGSDQPYIRSNLFKVAKIVFPTIKEQRKLANFLSKIDDKINAVNEQIETTKIYKKGLLLQMFV